MLRERVLQQDNDSKHTEKSVKARTFNNKIKIWSSQLSLPILLRIYGKRLNKGLKNIMIYLLQSAENVVIC